MRHTSLLLGLAATATLTTASLASAQTQPPVRLPATRITADTTNVLAVQNDRAAAVTVYARVNGVDRRLGVVPAGAVSSLAIPAWAASGTTLQVVARADGEDRDLVTQSLALRGARRVGLLVPPRGGLATNDSMLVKLNADELASTTLTVNNPRDKAVTVYAEQGTYSVRLGEVRAGEQTTLRVPKSLVSRENTIRVFVRPAGGLDLATQLINLKSGDHLGVRVAM
ncbi:MAG: hypothetical protein LCH84_02730 [Gemmatimonadetes bacterium]|nr:hypothetical protein [Gemmatimonadota bacterium]